MPNDAITPRGLHTHGKEFFAAAEAVQSSKVRAVLPLAFLWGRTIELLLKSYLLWCGVSVEVLRSRKFGHNLVALYREAQARGIAGLIGADPEMMGLMLVLNLEYGTKRLEYRESETMYMIPDAELARRVICRLVKGVNRHFVQNGI